MALGSSCAAWACVGVCVHTQHRGTDAGVPGGDLGRSKPPPVQGGDQRLQSVPAAPASVPRGEGARGELGCQSSAWLPSPTRGQRIALLPGPGKCLGRWRGSDGHRRVPSVPGALFPLWWRQQLSVSRGQGSSCRASASRTLCLRAKPSRPDAALPSWWLCSLLILDHVSLPSWQSAASPLLGAEKKSSASLYF